MRIARWATYLWPGLPQLWNDGAWSGLALSIGFALLVDLLLVATLVCQELLEPGVLRFGWLALGLAWVSSLVLMGWGERTRAAQIHAPVQQDLFRRALGEYLTGSWFEAESLCRQVLVGHPRDVEARLLLATVLRRSRRYADARRELADLERIETAARWRAEIEQEQQLLEEWIAGASDPAVNLGPGEPLPVSAIAPAA